MALGERRRQAWLLGLIVLGLVAGLAAGWWLGPAAAGFAWLGECFLRLLKMIIVPLIVASMIVGIASLGDIRRLGRTGLVTLVYYTVTTALAVILGLVLVNLVRPGEGVRPPGALPDVVRGKEELGVVDLLLSMVPENVVAAAADMQVLPLIVFSILFGAVLTTLGTKGRPVIQFFTGVNEAVMALVDWIMWVAPLGVFGLVAGRLGEAGGAAAFWTELSAVGWYAATVLGGLTLHGFVVLPLILAMVGRRAPWPYVRNVLPALLTAFSTASSSATLPVTLETVTDGNKVRRESAELVLPVGATINMDGTALYEAVAAMFIAQSYGIELGLVHQGVIFLTATLAAIGAAGIPQAGLVTMVLVLRSVGLPLEGIAVILSVDWFLDRCRTTVNVLGDSVGAAVVERFLPDSRSKPGSFRPVSS